MTVFKPLNGREYPRFSGIKSFFRLPVVEDEKQFKDLDVAIFGAPFDGGTSYRPGARFAPQEVRNISSLGRGVNIESNKSIFELLKIADCGDVPIHPQDINKTHKKIEKFVAKLLRRKCFAMMVGGDHSTTIGSLSAMYKKYGPLGLIHFDAHTDTYPQAWGCDVHHGTFVRIGKERGWFRDNAVVQIGIRGPFNNLQDISFSYENAFHVISVDHLRYNGFGYIEDIIKGLSQGPFYMSFDVDCLDPSFAPGTGTPVCGGLTTWECQQIIRECSNLQLVGADIVEVSPAYDNNGITSLAGVSMMVEILSAFAASRKKI